MADIFRSLIIPAVHADLARAIAASFGPGGGGMWTTPLSPTGAEPATHYISSGFIPPEFAFMAPYQEWTQDEQGAWRLVSTEPGNPVAVHGNATAQGVTCTLAEVEAIFGAADVTAQEPFAALARLGLAIVNPPMDA